MTSQFIQTETIATASEDLLSVISQEKEIEDPPKAVAEAIIRRSCACGAGNNGIPCKEV